MLASMAKLAQRAIRKQRERKIFLDLLRELRKQKGLTQGQLAKGIGAKQGFVSKYETGERRLDFLDLAGDLRRSGNIHHQVRRAV